MQGSRMAVLSLWSLSWNFSWCLRVVRTRRQTWNGKVVEWITNCTSISTMAKAHSMVSFRCRSATFGSYGWDSLHTSNMDNFGVTNWHHLWPSFHMQHDAGTIRAGRQTCRSSRGPSCRSRLLTELIRQCSSSSYISNLSPISLSMVRFAHESLPVILSALQCNAIHDMIFLASTCKGYCSPALGWDQGNIRSSLGLGGRGLGGRALQLFWQPFLASPPLYTVPCVPSLSSSSDKHIWNWTPGSRKSFTTLTFRSGPVFMWFSWDWLSKHRQRTEQIVKVRSGSEIGNGWHFLSHSSRYKVGSNDYPTKGLLTLKKMMMMMMTMMMTMTTLALCRIATRSEERDGSQWFVKQNSWSIFLRQ